MIFAPFLRTRSWQARLLVAAAAVVSASAAELGFDLKVERGRLPENMRRIRVQQGDAVTLRWTSDQPLVVQTKINRALADAPLCAEGDVPFKVKTSARGYLLEAFLPAAVLHGYDPEQNRRLGLYYAVHDNELGEQVLSVGAEFPYWEDPSLWSVLELMR